jgi:predicted negative regulator of RcsB-dependent stress response
MATPSLYYLKSFTDLNTTMSEQYDEHEQSERVKQWLLKNGANILTILLLLVSAIAAWQLWQSKQGQKSQEAANQYQIFVQAIEKNDPTKATVLGESFIKNYPRTGMAFLASLRMAKFYQDHAKPELALKALDQAVTLVHNEQDGELLNIRKAQLYLSQAKINHATTQINSFKPKAYPATYAEIQGDLALAKNQLDQAAKHYTQALNSLDPSSGSRMLIEMKLSEAGGTARTSSEIR